MDLDQVEEIFEKVAEAYKDWSQTESIDEEQYLKMRNHLWGFKMSLIQIEKCLENAKNKKEQKIDS